MNYFERQKTESIENYLNVFKQRNIPAEQFNELSKLTEMIHEDILRPENIEKILNGEFDSSISWMAYIPNEIRAIWGNLSDSAKLCIYRIAAKSDQRDKFEDDDF